MAAPPDESSKKPLPVLYIRPSFWQYFPSFSEWVVKPFMQGLMFGVAQHAGLFLSRRLLGPVEPRPQPVDAAASIAAASAEPTQATDTPQNKRQVLK